MATIKKPKIQPRTAEQEATLAAIRAAKVEGRSRAAVVFERMSHEAQGAALRAHS